MASLLPADGSGSLLIDRIALEGNVVILEGQAVGASARCPACGVASRSVHARYVRRPLDLPWRGRVVRLVVTVRRFRCRAAGCARKTFAELLSTHLAPWARRTADADHLLLRFAWTAGGEAGARLALAAGLPVSPDTLLRLLRRTAPPPPGTPRVLGVDDFALRRGRRYATILLDLETHQPIDLLPDRKAETLAEWLGEHPGVEVVVRDRAEAYAEGARRGAPAAIQVADRFHLVQNASAALDELLRGRRRRVEYVARPAATPGSAEGDAQAPALNRLAERQAAARTRRRLRWARVWELYRAGRSRRGIARDLGLARLTVKRYLDTPLPPAPPPALETSPTALPALTSPTLRPYATYLQGRWLSGCTNVSRLYRELVAQGYTASRSLLAQVLLPWRSSRSGRAKPARPTVRRLSLRWLCLQPPEHLDADERLALGQALHDDPELASGYRLLQRFRELVTQRERSALPGWLADARASQLPPFVSLADGIARDQAAVEAGLSLAWSNGPTEGQVNRLKLIKRQGYGRAKLDLLRRRVLPN